MSEVAEGTRGQSPEDAQKITPPPVFAQGDPVPGLSSWLLERKLGGGGFGEVWLAKHEWNLESRAVKFCTDPAARHRLVVHEKNVVLRVMKYAGNHPNIVSLLDCNLEGTVPWLMYEYVEGGTLADVMKAWRELSLPKRLGRAVRTLHVIAGALAACHRLDPPLVHRDLKPQNVLMAGSVPRITDFGIGSVVVPTDDPATAAQTAYAARLPSALHAAGTRIYAPPEQMLGAPPNPRDDVYALGIIAYQMVVSDMTTAPGADATLELSDLKIPGELASLIVRSVAMNADRRPKDATEWEAVLAAILQKAQIQLEVPDTPVTSSKPVLLPEPTEPTARLPSRAVPPPISPLLSPTELPPEPRLAVRPARARKGRAQPTYGKPRRVATIVIGIGLVFGLVGAILLLPPGKRLELSKPTERAEQSKGNAPDPKGEPPKGGPTEPKTTPKTEPKTEPRTETKTKPKPKNIAPEPRAVPKPGETRDIEIADGVKMTFCWVPAGECQLGSPKAELDTLGDAVNDEVEEKRGKFRTPGFWIGKYAVTQAEWQAVMGNNPSYFDGKKDNKAMGMDTSRFPVETVSWDMICGKDGKGGGDTFLDRANAHGGIKKAFSKEGKFALPHEDQWEYACRGGLGNGQPFYFGKELNGTQANCVGAFPFGTTTKGPGLERPTPGGNYAARYPHPWGLCDMHGNVWEWCENKNDQEYETRVQRGGSWGDVPHRCRAASRQRRVPGEPSWYVGVRLILSLDL